MKKVLYKEQAEALYREAEMALNLNTRDSEPLNTYTFLSANLSNFVPTMPHEQHWPLFEQYRMAQVLNGLDTTYFKAGYPLSIVGWDVYLRKLWERPGIICTYHFGAYQLINYLLIKNKLPFALLVAGEVKTQWSKRFPHLLTELRMAEENGLFVLLDANDSSSLRKMYKLTASGFRLLIYTDGLEGSKTAKEDQLQSISFLGQRIEVPKGVAQLSYTLDLPIDPLLALRRREYIELVSGRTIQPSRNVEKHIYMRETMRDLYGFLEPYLHHWPEQWTNWPLLHRLLSGRTELLGARDGQDSLPHDDTAYGIYSLGDQCFLLRKSDYVSFPLEQNEFDVLFDSWYGGRGA